jgi:hypothetical protein
MAAFPAQNYQAHGAVWTLTVRGGSARARDRREKRGPQLRRKRVSAKEPPA